MVDMETLYKTVDEMEPEEIADLLDYLIADKSILQPNESGHERVLGLHAHLGKAWMSDDFNEPLPDEFWLGDEHS